jgi:polyferredoxin
MEEIRVKNGNTRNDVAKRPFLLALLCLFSFVFFGLISLLFLIALFWAGTIADMVLRYAPEHSVQRFTVISYILGGLILHMLSLTGIILIWNMRRMGYLVFGVSTLIISGYQLFASQISPLTTTFYIALVILFGVFLKKLR